MLRANNIGFEVGGHALVDGVTLDLEAARMTAVLGPNGAGKSTLLRLLAGELKPTQGSVLLDGEPLANICAASLAQRRAVVPQTTVLAFPFTVREVVAMGQTVPAFARSGARDGVIIAGAMDRAGVAHLADRAYPTLSGGERQRVQLARAFCQLESAGLVATAGILMLDEPTASLDLAHQLRILEEVRRACDTGLSVLAILHDVNLAAHYADHVIVMANGCAVAAGSPCEVLTDAVLSDAYDCQVATNTPPVPGVPYVLPQACQPARGAGHGSASRNHKW